MEYIDVIGADLQKTTAQVSKLWPTGQIHPLPFSANQAVLEHSYDRLLCRLQFFHTRTSESSSCNKDCINPQSLKYLLPCPLQKKFANL